MKKIYRAGISAALLATLLLAAAMLFGCGAKTDSSSETDTNDSGSNATTTSETRTIEDQLGRIIEIPANVERIVPLGNTPRMITYLGLADKVVGIGGMAFDQVTPVTAYAYAMMDTWADLPIVGTDAAGATDYYPEQIISVQPDVILCSYSLELADEIQAKTGIPTIAVAQGTLFEEDYNEALRILGNVCGAKDRAEEVIAYIEDCLEDLNTRTANISDSNKPTVLGAAATFKGKHGIDGVYINYPVFMAINAKDIASEQAGPDWSSGVTVDKEQILGWNPDIIFLDAGNLDLVRLDYDENPDFYSQLSAFTKGEVYTYPNSTSYYSNVEIPIVNCYYVASLLYPDEFADIDFEQKASEVFEFFLNDATYLKTLEDGGYAYAKATF